MTANEHVAIPYEPVLPDAFGSGPPFRIPLAPALAIIGASATVWLLTAARTLVCAS